MRRIKRHPWKGVRGAGDTGSVDDVDWRPCSKGSEDGWRDFKHIMNLLSF